MGVMSDWHILDRYAVERSLETDLAQGLSDAQAARRLMRHGANEIIDKGAKSPWRILWGQITAVMVLILIAAAVLSLILQKQTETIAILSIVILFVALGFIQEYRAEKALAALKKLAVPLVRVLRNEKAQVLSARVLVPGDIILLEAGNVVPADVRIVESINLRIQEAMLTGESEPGEKRTDALQEKELPLGDRLNMGYMGTIVTYGRGRAVVVAAGMKTELGNIATLMQEVKPGHTPLQRRLDIVGKYNVKFRGQSESTFIRDLLSWVVPVLLFFSLWYFIFTKMRPGMDVMSFGKNIIGNYDETFLDWLFFIKKYPAVNATIIDAIPSRLRLSTSFKSRMMTLRAIAIIATERTTS